MHGYVSIYRRLATQPWDLKWGFETTSNQDLTPTQLISIISQNKFLAKVADTLFIAVTIEADKLY